MIQDQNDEVPVSRTGGKQCFIPGGVPVFIAADSPTEHFSRVSEDDGETGYFYAYDRRTEEDQILDAVHV